MENSQENTNVEEKPDMEYITLKQEMASDDGDEDQPKIKQVKLTINSKITPRRRGGKSHVCKICDDVFTNEKLLRKHKKTHKQPKEDLRKYEYLFDKEQNVYTCKTCENEYNTQEEVEKHLETHREVYNCPECQESFYVPYQWTLHVWDHRQGEYECPECDFKSIRSATISGHIRRIHLHIFTYYCKFCGKGSDDHKIHQEHEMAHTENPPKFDCIVCGASFPFTRYLYTHQVRNHKVTIEGMLLPYQCDICFKVYSKSNPLEKHMMIKHSNVDKKPNEKKHLCDICGKGFARIAKLKMHYNTHTGVKPYSCSYCEKSFTKRDYLVLHERTHNGVKPYKCPHCDKRFNQGGPLRIHVRTHTGQRPYICHLCEGGYISRGSLNLHLKSCTGMRKDD